MIYSNLLIFSPIASGSKKSRPQRKRKSCDNLNRNDSDDDTTKHSKSKLTKRHSTKEKRKSTTQGEEDKSFLNVTLLETGGERYNDVWGKKIPPEILLKIFQCVTSMDGGAIPFLLRLVMFCLYMYDPRYSFRIFK
jgi:hypothetical protein